MLKPAMVYINISLYTINCMGVSRKLPFGLSFHLVSHSFKYLSSETLLENRIINNWGNEVCLLSEIEKYNPNQSVVYKNSEINMISYKNKTQKNKTSTHTHTHMYKATVLHTEKRTLIKNSINSRELKGYGDTMNALTRPPFSSAILDRLSSRNVFRFPSRTFLGRGSLRVLMLRLFVCLPFRVSFMFTNHHNSFRAQNWISTIARIESGPTVLHNVNK